MGYRIHTGHAPHVGVWYATVEAVDHSLGYYEHAEEERDDLVLVVDDGGNQEAFVLTGSSEELTDLARRILASVTGSNGLEHRVAHDLHKMHDSTGISVDDWPDGRAFIEKYDGPVDLHRDDQ